MEKTDVVMINKKKHTGGQGSVRKILCWLLACSLLAAQFDTTVLAAEQTDIEILAESEAAGDTENNDDAEAVDEYAEDGVGKEAGEDLENADNTYDAADAHDDGGETDAAGHGSADNAVGASENADKSDAADENRESNHEVWEERAAVNSSESGAESSESSSGTNIVVSRNADVVFVLDVSASMGGYIDKVKAKMTEFINTLDGADVNVRVKLVCYSDITVSGEDTVCSDWCSTVDEAMAALNRINILDGEDTEETALDGMGFMFQKDFGWRESVSKFSILLTDAIYKSNNIHGETFDSIKKKLEKQGIVSSAIVPTSVSCYDDWIVNGGKTGNIGSSDYSFLLDWVDDVILPDLGITLNNVDIKVNKDNVSWEGHGKVFKLKNEKGNFVRKNSSVTDGSYKIYELDADGTYIDTGKSITVNGEDTSCTIDYYTMTFYDNDTAYGDDTPWHKQIIMSGLSGTCPENPEKNGYVFRQWTAENGGHTEFDFSTPISGTVNLYANWVSKGVDIKARKDDALWEDSGRRYCLRPYVDSEESLASVISENDVFSDYITDLSNVDKGKYRVYELCITQVPDRDDIVNYVDTGLDFTVTDDNRTIYVDYYTVTFHDGDTTYGDATSQHSQIVMKNKYASEPVKPVKECYVFNRWLTEKTEIQHLVSIRRSKVPRIYMPDGEITE